MSKARFSVTFEIVTPESAEAGDVAERGEIDTSLSLRDALQALNETRTCHVDGVHAIEPNAYPLADTVRVHWVTIINGMEYLTGAQESRALHIPDSVTRASSRRIARLCGVKVVRWDVVT